MKTFARGFWWVFGITLICLGLYLLINDALVIAHIIAPHGDGPYGVISGPVISLIGIVLLRWLKLTEPVD
jgi:hypothetical protein